MPNRTLIKCSNTATFTDAQKSKFTLSFGITKLKTTKTPEYTSMSDLYKKALSKGKPPKPHKEDDDDEGDEEEEYKDQMGAGIS